MSTFSSVKREITMYSIVGFGKTPEDHFTRPCNNSYDPMEKKTPKWDHEHNGGFILLSHVKGYRVVNYSQMTNGT